MSNWEYQRDRKMLEEAEMKVIKLLEVPEHGKNGRGLYGKLADLASKLKQDQAIFVPEVKANQAGPITRHLKMLGIKARAIQRRHKVYIVSKRTENNDTGRDGG